MEYDLSRIAQLAKSPAGQQLIGFLQKNNAADLRSAMAKAAGGDLEGARQALSAVLDTPQMQKLVKELEDTP